MAWIRLDTSIIEDEFISEKLAPEQRLAWIFFLLRVKANGSRGSVPVTSPVVLARSWNIPADAVAEMLRKVKEVNGDGFPRVTESGGRWFVRNWSKYQEDHKGQTAKGEKGEFSGYALNGTTVQDRTLQDRTEQDTTSQAVADKSMSASGWEMVIQNEWGIPFTRIPAKTLQEISELSQKHGKDKTLHAIQEARKYSKMSTAYVRAILEPKSQHEKVREQLIKQEQERAKR